MQFNNLATSNPRSCHPVYKLNILWRAFHVGLDGNILGSEPISPYSWLSHYGIPPLEQSNGINQNPTKMKLLK